MEIKSSLLHMEIKLYCLSCILLNLSHFTMYFVCHGLVMVTLAESCKINEIKLTGRCSLLSGLNLSIILLIIIVNITDKSTKLFQRH